MKQKSLSAALMLLITFIGIMTTGCSSYKPGKITNGVYDNGIFKVTTPSGFTCYQDKDVAKVSHYIVCYNKSQKRGAEKSFNCEYAADGGAAEILVASEDNASGISVSEFADIISTQTENDIMGYSLTENKDVTVNGANFRKLGFSASGGNITYYITEKDKKFVYIYILTLDHDFTGADEKAFASISAS